MIDENKTILIAEDEDDLRQMYTIALSAAGFEVIEASDGAQALSLLEEKYEVIDLILLDIVMPGMDGFETLENLKKDERFKNIPVLVSTNLDNDDDKREALKMGAKDYFVKSKHTPSELAAKVKMVISE
ncbi:MAG: Response regulator receiver domain protein [Candidatus Moranbacteria bacterium GW2011_GWE1_36_7]|nr:MAG: Response regulator receiver domain protein [Candidatus Moranbacteria bacterium GW2011_GWD2_36_12]KKQ06108.1 MAG: Response regulator receiver domain protein [Candidatus Moranbacteria bacterium GW2011_GWE2_36_40]KKQ11892.1 MAG: Response regulator receiver domain protein [Candidatus Moranbacteria bacterium GW2011_GWE1_36_7]